MKIKKLAAMMMAAVLAANAAFGQTVSVTGTVAAVTDALITMTSGKDMWLIKRTSTTTVTTGTLSVGSMVTVQCASGDVTKQGTGDAQKKE
ncbi:MAG TPA: hypothetical protein VLK27_01025 [Chthoniobacterales bacterium]|nr:hypothetical protein [Chthoniobacterales bacterium]